jgi:hypothetical protein
MDSIKPSADKLDLLERLCERAEKESLKKLLEEIKTDIQLLDILLLGLRSVSTAPDYSALYSGPSASASSSGYSTTAWLRTWEVKIEAAVNEEGLQLLNQKVNARYPCKTDK